MTRRLLRVFCGLIPLALSLTMALGYWGLVGNAATYNEAHPDKEMPIYDTCFVNPAEEMGYRSMSMVSGLSNLLGDIDDVVS